ncbi:hypothetical protein MKZ38_008686 [Zalerion maritima]|uniref:Uncharacterized protein n=1 Tax=Zalerion maritima TaxID=339359 RepID=A0AAD5RKP6_9PEZI|nr:hypothetical protein MKZ38_008686 [Zalerion maritima]
MGTLDLAQISQIQAELAELETPEAPPLTSEELQHFWDRGNKRRPLPPNCADNTKVNLANGERRWRAFCAKLPGHPAWKPLLKTLSWENRGLAELFARYLMRREKSRIGALSTIRVYLRELSAVYRRYTDAEFAKQLRNHFVAVAKIEITPKFGLRVEPKHKKVLNPAGFTYLAYFRWVRDRTRFKIGLDRIDDALARIFFMWTGYRKYELVYTQPKNIRKKIEEFDGESNAYTDIDNDSDEYVEPRPKDCWVCGRLDERREAVYKVLCWENINLWILRDALGDGSRDRLAMQVLLRFHKNHNNEMVPTWYPFVEEKLPVLCPITYILAKALAEGVIDKSGYDTRAEPFFGTKLGIRAVHIIWKEEFWHKPVFRQTAESIEGPVKSDEPVTSGMFDNNSNKLGTSAGLPGRFQLYCYRRGNLNILDRARHRPNSAVYQRHYANAIRNALVQDAGLGRGTELPYLDILNYMGIQYDENAPTGVFDKTMCAIGPDARVRELEREWSALEAELQAKYGKSTKATGADKKRRDQKQNELRVARQTQRRKVAAILRRKYFKEKNNEELDRQLCGVHEPQQPLQKVVFHLPERRLIANILSDLDKDLPEDEIVRRKVDAINALVSYAWKIEPKEEEAESSQHQTGVRAPSAGIERRSEAQHAETGSGRPIAPRPWYVSMIRDTMSSPPVPPEAAEIQTPPPPYSAVANSHPVHVGGHPPHADEPGENRRNPTPHQEPAKIRHECIFCRRRFTRRGTMWDCVERYLKRCKGGVVPCPCPECKANGFVSDNETRFKNHAKVVHGIELRPKIIIRAKSGEANRSGGGRSTSDPSPKPRIVLVSRVHT